MPTSFKTALLRACLRESSNNSPIGRKRRETGTHWRLEYHFTRSTFVGVVIWDRGWAPCGSDNARWSDWLPEQAEIGPSSSPSTVALRPISTATATDAGIWDPGHWCWAKPQCWNEGQISPPASFIPCTNFASISASNVCSNKPEICKSHALGSRVMSLLHGRTLISSRNLRSCGMSDMTYREKGSRIQHRQNLAHRICIAICITMKSLITKKVTDAVELAPSAENENNGDILMETRCGISGWTAMPWLTYLNRYACKQCCSEV